VTPDSDNSTKTNLVEHHLDFGVIEKKLREQSEQYRERHLSVKLSLYAGFFAFDFDSSLFRQC
jgi:hypothetical protein